MQRLFLLMLLCSFLVVGEVKVRYNLSMDNPHNHYFQVEMHVSGIDSEYVEVSMPVWAPGSYLVREFARNVENFSAWQGGNAVSWQKLDKNTWRVHSKAEAFHVRYDVYAYELTVRTSFLDASHGYINGTSVFMFVEGYQRVSHYVKIRLPEEWKQVSTGLTKESTEEFLYSAPDYDFLVDCPIEMGNQEIYSFEVKGIRHEVAIYGYGNFDASKVVADTLKIIEATYPLFGEDLPYDYYLFIYHFQPGLRGGLEHLNSTTVAMDSWSFSDPVRYAYFLSIVAHEYYHLWNVKRIRPKGLGPFNYDVETYTKLLWVAEGVTSYYDDWLVHRAKLITEEAYLKTLGDRLGGFLGRPGRLVQSLEESSFNTWIKFYRQNENSINDSISYYTKGSLVSWILDIEILVATNGAKSLDDVMLALWQEFKDGRAEGFSTEEFKALCEQVSGQDMDPFFSNYISGTKEVDFNNYLSKIGLQLRVTESKIPLLGINTKTNGAGHLVVKNVLRNSPAYRAGLNVGDEIIALDDFRVYSNTFDARIAEKKAGSTFTILISRNLRLHKFSVTLDQTKTEYFLEKITDLDDERKNLYNKWLHR